MSTLRAFEAAARLGNLSAAARELNVTHAAVAQHVRKLENWFGIPLMARSGRGVAPTARGEDLAAGLAEGFTSIRSAVQRLHDHDSTRPIWITCTPTFASNWLMPQLDSFRDEVPDIEVMINPTSSIIDIKADNYDIAIRFGDGEWPGLEAHRLISSSHVLIAAPSLLERHPVESASDLIHLPWIQEFGTDEMRHWIESHGVDTRGHKNVLNLPGHLALDAVRRGQGIGMTAAMWVREDIEAGRLVALVEQEQDPKVGYYLLARKGPHRPTLKKFLAWARRALEC